MTIEKITQLAKQRSGSTLVELLLYLGLFSIVLAIITNLFLTTLEVYQEAQAVSLIEQQGRFIVSRIQYDVVRADNILVPAGLGEMGDSLTLTIGAEQVSYQLSGTTLQWSSAGNTEALHSSDIRVDSITFERLGNVAGTPTVQMFIHLSELSQTGSVETRSYQTTFGLR